MYEFKVVTGRYFPIKLPNGRCLNLEPPKLKALNRIQKAGDDMESVAQTMAIILSKNREKYRVKAEDVMDMLDMDQITDFLESYLGWINGEKAADPN